MVWARAEYWTDRFAGLNDLSCHGIIEVNGYLIRKPERFKNLAHERGYEVALRLAEKKLSVQYTQRMGDMVIEFTSPAVMYTSEVVDIIMYDVSPSIQLREDAKIPHKVAKDAMDYVPSFFGDGIVTLKKSDKWRKMWFLEINRNP
jgi:hypothetical protein